MSELIFDMRARHCDLCNDTGNVQVIPYGGGPNDAQEDECPWCLRREFNRLRSREAALESLLREARGPTSRRIAHCCSRRSTQR